MNPEKNEIPDFYKVQHVELDGYIYDIFPVGGEVGMFLLVNNDTQEMERINVGKLEERGFRPIELVKSVKMDPETGLPENSIEHIEQMRYETQDGLDSACKGKLFVP